MNMDECNRFFKAEHGTSIMIIYHGDDLILGCESRICDKKTNEILTKIKIAGDTYAEAEVSEKAVVHPCFVGVSAGPMKVKDVLKNLGMKLSSSDNGQTVYMNDILPIIESEYNDLVKIEKQEVFPSRVIVAAIDKETNKLAVHYFGIDKERVTPGGSKIEPVERVKCFGQGAREAKEILDKGFSIEKKALDMVELMYEAMNAVFAKNKFMGGEFHGYIISIENGRLRTRRQDLRTILGNKRKRVAQKDADEIAHSSLCREMKMA